ncbi:MAG: PilW family protein [Gammaproteobacteria bacterium]|nr:PilW family protein [Gammaproteobacteria bacterium]
MMQRRVENSKCRMAGFGLVEILIAMVLGLVLTIGMINVFLSSKQAYRTQDALSVIQENGRYVMEVLSRTIRMAGYQGCGNLAAVIPNVLANGMPGSGTYSANQAIRGYAYNGSSFSPLYGDVSSSSDDPVSVAANTDMLTVSRAELVTGCGNRLSSSMGSDSEALSINGLKSGSGACELDFTTPGNEYMLITDCETSDLFRVTDLKESGGVITIEHGAGSNSSARLSKHYATDAQVFRFIHSDFYVKNNSFGQPALFLRENGGVEQELVDGVQDLTLLYGEDTDSDLAADQYTAGPSVADWSDVTSVRITLTLASKANNITVTGGQLTQTMTATIGLRNKVP